MNIKEISASEKRLLAQSANYKLLRIGQRVLNNPQLHMKEQHRTVWCGRSIKWGDEGTGEGGFVGVHRNENRDGASFSGLLRCGNPHTCPICSGKIGERRRKQLSIAVVNHCKENDGAMYLCTLTFPHHAEFGNDSRERLEETIKKLNKARERFKNSNTWKNFQLSAANIPVKKRKNKDGKREEMLAVGAVTSLEFTISNENGWHPHLHMLLFCKKFGLGEDEKIVSEETDLYCKNDIASNLVAKLKKVWVETLFKVGLGDKTKLTEMMKRALNIRGGEFAAAYIAKMGHEPTIHVDANGKKEKRWSLSREVACTHAKKGMAGERWGTMHYTPFQLLALCEKNPNESKQQYDDRCWAYRRFNDYAAATVGKKALCWTPGLKEAMGVEDSDEENWLKEEDPMPEQIQVGRLNARQYSKLLSCNKIPEFLEYVATCCDTQEHLDEFIESLENEPDIASGALLVKRKSGREVFT